MKTFEKYYINDDSGNTDLYYLFVAGLVSLTAVAIFLLLLAVILWDFPNLLLRGEGITAVIWLALYINYRIKRATNEN